MTDQPTRRNAATITDNDLEQLRADLTWTRRMLLEAQAEATTQATRAARAEQDRDFTREANRKAVQYWYDAAVERLERAEQAEAAITRVDAVCERLHAIANAACGTPTSSYDRALARAADLVRTAFTEPKEPRP